MAGEFGAELRGPGASADGADEQRLAAEQGVGDGGVERGTSGSGLEVPRVDLGVFLGQAVEPVEDVEGGSADEEDAGRVHVSEVHCRHLPPAVGTLMAG